jgi:hypothetical protein
MSDHHGPPPFEAPTVVHGWRNGGVEGHAYRCPIYQIMVISLKAVG